jgi:hypothetical protein
MAERGRKKMFQSKEEWAVVVSLRVPRDVYDQVQRYLKMHPRMTLTEFILDGIRLRLETPADPRDMILSDDNTVIRELQEMVDAAVQRALAREKTAPPALDAAPHAPAPETPAPDSVYDDNTIIQKKVPRGSTPPGQYKLTSRQVASLRAKRQRGAPIKALMEEYGISKATLFRYLK